MAKFSPSLSDSDQKAEFLERLVSNRIKKYQVVSDEVLQKQQKKQELRQSDQIHQDYLEERKNDRLLKEKVAKWTFKLLIAETAIVFAVLFLQGFAWNGFNIHDTTLNIFLPATIIQISTMAIIITRSLFPNKPGSN